MNTDAGTGQARSIRLAMLSARDEEDTLYQRADATIQSLSVVHEVCEALWRFRSNDLMTELVNFGNRDDRPWREVRSLAGSVAESLMLAGATRNELRLHGYALANGIEDRGFALAERYLAEVLVGNLVGIGHRLVNMTARTLSRDRDIAAQINEDAKRSRSRGPLRTLSEIVADNYVPFDNKGRGWLSMNSATVEVLECYYAASHGAVVEPLRALVDAPSWSAICEHRAIGFHRWRPEDELVQGVDQGSGRVVTDYDAQGNVRSRGVHASPRPYTAAAGLRGKIVADAIEGLEEVVRCSEALVDRILSVLPVLSEGAIGTTRSPDTKAYRDPAIE